MSIDRDRWWQQGRNVRRAEALRSSLGCLTRDEARDTVMLALASALRELDPAACDTALAMATEAYLAEYLAQGGTVAE